MPRVACPWKNTKANFKAAVPAPHSCFIVGATGEVGRCLVQETLSSNVFDRVVVVARRTLNYDGPNKDVLDERIIEDFDTLAEHSQVFADCQFGFCCLGTTRSKAGSAGAFRKVDFDYTRTVATLAKAAGCKWFGVVSAAGAAQSSAFLYVKTKGDIEAALVAIDLPHLFIYRPGLLICQRKEVRFFERLAIRLSPVLDYFYARNGGERISIETAVVAKAMLVDAVETALASARGRKEASVKVISNAAMIDSVKLAGHVQ